MVIAQGGAAGTQGWRPEMLLNILRCTGLPGAESDLAPNVTGVEEAGSRSRGGTY